jgi:predicted RNase H-like HicB family nuclease
LRRFTIFVTPEEGAYVVDVPALPGCHSVGNTLPEAIQNAQEAIGLYLDTLKEHGEPIPDETEHPQASVIEVADTGRLAEFT